MASQVLRTSMGLNPLIKASSFAAARARRGAAWPSSTHSAYISSLPSHPTTAFRTASSSFSTTALSSFSSSSDSASTPSTSPAKSVTMTQPTTTALFEAMKIRRSHYGVKKEATISDDQIKALIEQAVLHTPSSFNSQSTRYILLLNKQHEKLWDFAKEALKGVLPEAEYAASEPKLNMFQGAYGSILFFEDRSVVTGMQEKFPLYAHNFPVWAGQSDGMSQYAVWLALSTEGMGASLQHYSPLIDEKVNKEWNVPESWELKAQMVFGTPSSEPNAKTFNPVEDRFKVYA